MEDIIREFWDCSLRSNFEEFDWDNAFDTYEHPLKQCVVAHGLGSFEDFKEQFEEYYNIDQAAIDLENLDWAVVQRDNIWWSFDGYEALDGILRAKWEKAKLSFEGNVHGDLADLLERIQEENRRHLSLPKLIELFDECIHAEHATGMILEDIDIDDLRHDAELEWEEEMAEKQKFPTNIRELRAL